MFFLFHKVKNKYWIMDCALGVYSRYCYIYMKTVLTLRQANTHSQIHTRTTATPPVTSYTFWIMRHNLISWGGCDWLIGLTEWRSVGHQDVDAFRDEVPFIQQRLTPRQVKPPTVKPWSPAKREGERSYRYQPGDVLHHDFGGKAG